MRLPQFLFLFTAIGFAAWIGASDARAQALATIDALTDVQGTYSPFSLGAVTYSGSFSVEVNAGTADLVIYMGRGANYSNKNNSRRLSAGGKNYLQYDLCQDASCAQAWGDADPNGVAVSWQGSRVDLNFFMRLPAAQDAAAGSYGDTITVTVDVI